MTAYDKLKAYHAAHVYKRGEFKGDAPFDQRWATHKRILAPGEDCIACIMHGTHILTARRDGTVVLRGGGWENNRTTRDAFYALLWLCDMPGYIYTSRLGGYPNTALKIRSQPQPVVFYDGMELDAQGALVSPPRPWTRRVADREARKAHKEQIKPLLDMLPVLHAGIDPARGGPAPWQLDTHKRYLRRGILPDAEHWVIIVWLFSFTKDPDFPRWKQRSVFDPDWRKCRARLLADVCTATKLVEEP